MIKINVIYKSLKCYYCAKFGSSIRNIKKVIDKNIKRYEE